MRLGQPHRIAHLGFETLFLQVPKGFGNHIAGEEQIEIFGVAPDAGVLLQREGAGDNVGDACAVQMLQHLAEKRTLLRRKIRRNRRANR